MWSYCAYQGSHVVGALCRQSGDCRRDPPSTNRPIPIRSLYTPTLPYITPYADNQTTPSSQHHASNNAILTPLQSTHLTSFCVPSIHIYISSVTCRSLENTLVKTTTIVPTHLCEGTIVCWVDHGGRVFRKTHGRKG